MKAATDKLRDLIAGRGPARIKLVLAEVAPCRDELAALIADHPEIDYYHDCFRDYWILSRPATGDLFPEARHG